ncbi:MAG TPA: histidine kinase [Ramlibacter sp.]|uniref:sensor histidine kinase n=1 Tax=Ramlibacter sp. TaxID=1917967 RepID=UPI002C3BC1EC|nr:histidine kinase [Ramlibacter sp.]HVZ46217.1 histidine kinase [Ramlibacter sp.]
MSANPPAPAPPSGPARVFALPRVAVVVLVACLLGLFLAASWKSDAAPIVARTCAVGLVAMMVFGLFEQWPRHLPDWLPRWSLQVAAVMLVIPFSVIAVYIATTPHGAPPVWKVQERLMGMGMMLVLGLMIGPLTAVIAVVRRTEATSRHQALVFELERSELERRASDARLHLLQAQVAPHFLFNTLANVQALVDAGSPQASALLRSLTAYLRAAVPRLAESASTLGQELQMVEAYLQLMHARLPDRLRFSLTVDEAARALYCPPMALLTLVENAVRHGIDPGEEGGRIDVEVQVHGERCIVRVSDTGVGLPPSASTGGTGLAVLRERMKLAFGDTARLQLSARSPGGVVAEMEFPARGAMA